MLKCMLFNTPHVEMVNEGWEVGKLNDALALLTFYWN